MRAASQDFLNYSYDSLKRLTGIQVVQNNAENYHPFVVAQSYVGLGSNRTTTQIEFFNYRTLGGALIAGNKYVYDNAGNIKEIRESESPYRVLYAYTYDSLNQLTQELRYAYSGNSTTPSSTVATNYTYDTAGNILSTSDGSSTVSYGYDDTNWADRLTSIQIGNTTKTITYDGASGNPSYWYNGTAEYYDLTWEQGRRLTYLEAWDANSQNRISYSYDMSGIRTSKVIESERHDYVTQSGKVVRETFGTKVLDFYYDAGGRPFALNYSTDNGSTFTKYYYVLNAQGDVVGLLNSSGTLVARYAYDAWGKPLSVTDSTSTGIADINPLRYRGYFWDSETGWYYLQSRYYDPIVKRFLNEDVLYSTGQGFLGYNMFAYCNNNSVSFTDETGCKYKLAMELYMVSLNCSDGDQYDFSSDSNPYSYIGDLMKELFEKSESLHAALYRAVISNIFNRKTDCGSVVFNPYNSDNSADKELKFAVGQATITYKYTSVCYGDYYVVTVEYTISDTYNFEHWGKAENQTNHGLFLNTFNNLFGYNPMMMGVLHSYNWSFSGTYTFIVYKPVIV